MKLQITNERVNITESEILLSNSVNIYNVEFEFADVWGEYSKFAIFKNGDTAVELKLSGNSCTIPWEVLQRRGRLTIGIRGISADKVKPTLWSDEVAIFPGVDDGEESKPPTPSVYQQILEKLPEDVAAYLEANPPKDGETPNMEDIVAAVLATGETAKVIIGDGAPSLEVESEIKAGQFYYDRRKGDLWLCVKNSKYDSGNGSNPTTTVEWCNFNWLKVKSVNGVYPDENGNIEIGFTPQQFGAKADGVTDDTEAIQAAFDACHASGGGEIRFPKGVYLLGDAVKFYSNQHIIGEIGTVLLQRDGNTGGVCGNLMRNYNNGGGGYTVTNNVVIEGLTFDGGTQETAPATLLAFCHSENITVKNCSFINGLGNSTVGNAHDIEVNSSKDILITGCKINSNRRTSASSEAIQIDAFYHRQAYPWLPDEGDDNNNDDTISVNIRIEECKFSTIPYDKAGEPAGCAIGNHGNLGAENVHVKRNYFYNYANAIKFTVVDKLYFESNHLENVWRGMNITGIAIVGYALNNIFISNDDGTLYGKKTIRGHGNIFNGALFEKDLLPSTASA